MSKKIITISRQFGSGGRTVGKKLAEKLGYKYYDREILEKIAVESGFSKKYIEEIEEQSTYKGLFNIGLLARDYVGKSVDDYIWEAQTKIIKEIADSGENAVIVGRCSDYILKDNKDTLHVFVHADIKKRKKRVRERYGDTEVSLEKRLKDKDKRRKVYYKFYTDRDWGNIENFTLTLNSGELGIENCIKTIEEVVKLEKEPFS